MKLKALVLMVLLCLATPALSSQNDLVVPNGTGQEVREGFNDAIDTLVTNNSGLTAPSTSKPFMFWADTTAGILRIRNATNTTWLPIWALSVTGLTFSNNTLSLSDGYAIPTTIQTSNWDMAYANALLPTSTPTFAGLTLTGFQGIVKASSGVFGTATSGVDYAPATVGSWLLRGNGSGGFAAAISGSDYAPPTAGAAILKGNGSGGFSNAVAGTDYVAPTGSGAQLTGVIHTAELSIDGTFAANSDSLVASQKAIKTYAEAKTNRGAVNGYASLGADGKVPSTQLPSSTQAWPVGSVFISISSTNPATSLGYGTWVAFGAGRCLVSLDAAQTEFDVPEETGGEKTHTLTTGEMPSHSHSYSAILGSGSYSGGPSPTAYGSASTYTTGTTGSGNSHNNLQPYITVYMFKRTS
jgi:hypothetical protein